MIQSGQLIQGSKFRLPQGAEPPIVDNSTNAGGMALVPVPDEQVQQIPIATDSSRVTIMGNKSPSRRALHRVVPDTATAWRSKSFFPDLQKSSLDSPKFTQEMSPPFLSLRAQKTPYVDLLEITRKEAPLILSSVLHNLQNLLDQYSQEQKTTDVDLPQFFRKEIPWTLYYPVPQNLQDHQVSHVDLDLPQIPQDKPYSSEFHALQEWEGYVVKKEIGKFVAHLIDLTAGSSHASQEATIPLVEISERDAENMTVGSVFHWAIGYEYSPKGDKQRVSKIVFRDSKMTEADIQEGKEWAEKVAPLLNRDKK